MKVKIKPQSYGPIHVRADREGKLLYGREAGAVDNSAPPGVSPAETLLASIAGCMVLSINIIAGKRKIETGPFVVAVQAHKADNPPSRFGTYDITVSKTLLDDSEAAMTLVKQAKAMCTVSNSLSGEIRLKLV